MLATSCEHLCLPFDEVSCSSPEHAKLITYDRILISIMSLGLREAVIFALNIVGSNKLSCLIRLITLLLPYAKHPGEPKICNFTK